MNENDISYPLLNAAKPDLFEKNVFRITGLPVYASEKEIKKSAENQKIKEELGVKQQEDKRSFPLVTPARADQIQEAMTRIRDPQSRVVDEFFWFWPINEDGSDAAFKSFMRGDSDDAFVHWTQGAAVSKSSISAHNLAVMFQLTAMDWTNYQLAEDVSPERAEKIKIYWDNAHSKWRELSQGDNYWSRFKSRVASMNEPMLTTGFVRRLIQTVQISLASIHAEYAIKFLNCKKRKIAAEHSAMLKSVCQTKEQQDYVISRTLNPNRNKIKQAIEHLQDKVKASPSEGDQIVIGSLTIIKEQKAYYSLLLGDDDAQSNELLDQACITLLRSLDFWVNHTKEAEKYLNILSDIEPLATGHEVLNRIESDKKWANNVISEKRLSPGFQVLKKINESKQRAKVKLVMFRNEFMPIFAGLIEAEGAGAEPIVYLSDAASGTVRSIAIEAYNDENDISTSFEAIRLAKLLAADVKLKEKIEGDIQTLEENKKQALCHFCKKNTADKNNPRIVPMYGDVSRVWRTTHFRHLEIKVPQCQSCKQIQSRNEVISWIVAIAFFGIGTLLFPALFFVWVFPALLIRMFIAWVMESNSDLISKSEYREIKELLNKGWNFGSKP